MQSKSRALTPTRRSMVVKQGFVTIALDVTFWGSSEGEPHNAVLPDVYVESFSAAVDSLSSLNFVDRERIGAVGVRSSRSFAISAARIDTRIAAIATSSMYNTGAANRNSLRHAVSVKQRKDVIAATSQ